MHNSTPNPEAYVASLAGWQRLRVQALRAATLAGRADEYVFLPALLDIARDCGFAAVQIHQATLDEWDSFESGYAARYARWLAAHPADHPDASTVRTKAHKIRPPGDGELRGH